MNSNNEERNSLGQPIPKNLLLKHTEGMRIVDHINWLVVDVNTHRPQGCLIVSDSNNGKTFLLKYAMKLISENYRTHATQEPEDSNRQDGGPKLIQSADELPAVYIRAPVKANHKNLLRDIASKIRVELPERASIGRIQDKVRNGLVKVKAKVVFVDELQHLLTGGENGKRVVIDDIKVMSDELGIPFVTAGTYQALSVIASDTQYSSRLRPVFLPLWKYDQNFIGLLHQFENRMNVKEGSFLGEKESREVFVRCKGVIGGVVETLNEALRLAEGDRANRITLDHIRRCGAQYLDPRRSG